MSAEGPDHLELERLIRRGRLYALIDACDRPDVPPRMAMLGTSRAVSLYAGLPNEGDWAIGAYLAQLDLPLLTWIEATLPAESWGVLVESAHTLAELLPLLQRFVVVKSAEGEPQLFRFYDPRVLVAHHERAHQQASARALFSVGRFGTLHTPSPVAWMPAM